MDMNAARAHLDELWGRGRAFLGTEYAIMGGAMTWVSERNLVSALSNGGGFGVIACGAMGPELLSGEIAATKTLTDRPFGVNLITMHPEEVGFQAAIIVVSSTDGSVEGLEERVGRLFIDHEVRFVRNREIEAFVREVEADVH